MLPSNIDVTKQITKPGSIKPVLLQWRQESGEYSQWRKLTAKVAVKEIFFFFFVFTSKAGNLWGLLIRSCAIWYHLYNFKNVKNTHGRVLLLVKLQAQTFNFTKSKAPPWVSFTFLKSRKYYQIAQSVTWCF